MDADEWAAISRLLDEALDLSPNERLVWLERLGPEHDALRPRLRRMLETPPVPAGRLVLPAFDDLDDESPRDARTRPRGGVGPYRLLRRLADGGMGTVWQAERADGLITRPVALKLPRGNWQPLALLDRMAREREILSRLEHPNIARLYDTGLTDDGQPYLALEFVEGQHINDYCAHHALGVSERLRLFLQVLDAVAHAHARLIVHRDLKPSNILVTDAGEVKLLDFGIAKLLTGGEAPETQLTELGGRPLTPEYASPEQRAGQPLTIASDVYSLGVVLYELLTGSRAGSAAGGRLAFRPEPEHAGVPQTDPAPPSAAATAVPFAAALRGDLDTIVLKAMKRVPGERYPTVNAFADDIRRHMDGLPILARPDSAWYRLSKFASRHALPLTAASLALAAVLVGAAAAVWQARVAREEQRRAEEVKNFLASIFKSASPFAAAGQSVTAADLLKQARVRIDSLEGAGPELRTELLTLVGTGFTELADMSTAEPILRAAADEGARRLGPDHPLTLQARTALTLAHRYTGGRDEAAAALEDLLPRLRRNPDLIEELIEALESQASVAMSQARWDAAIASSQEMIALARPRFGELHPLTLAGRWSLVQSYVLAGRNEEAAREGDEAFPLTLQAYRDDPAAPALIEARELYGRVLSGVGRLKEGVALIAQALDSAEKVFGPDSLHIGFYAANLAPRQRDYGDFDAALAAIDRAIAATAVAPGPRSGVHAFAHHMRGRILLGARRGAHALTQMEAAIEKLETTDEKAASQGLPTARAERALALAYEGRVSEALTAALRTHAPSSADGLRILGTVQRIAGAHADALATQRKAAAALPAGPGTAVLRSTILIETGLNQLELGDVDAASASLDDALGLTRTLERRPVPESADLQVGLARVALARGRPDAAIPLLEEADAFWTRFDPKSRWAAEARRLLDRARARR
jgi:serine/threonine-protein kinase